MTKVHPTPEKEKDMSSVIDRPARAKEAARQLAKVGVKANPYEQSPLAKELLYIAMPQGDVFRLWPGDAELDISGDPHLRLAVPTATERKREITRSYSFYHYRGT